MICKIKFISSLNYWKKFNQKEKITLQNILRHRTFQLLFFAYVIKKFLKMIHNYFDENQPDILRDQTNHTSNENLN